MKSFVEEADLLQLEKHWINDFLFYLRFMKAVWIVLLLMQGIQSKR